MDDVRPEPGGEPALEPVEPLPYLHRGLQRVRSGELVDVHPHARLAVEAADLVVLLRSQFDPGDILQPDDDRRSAPFPRLVFLDDDIAELLGGHQPAEGRQRCLERLPFRCRLLADAAGGDLEILTLEGQTHVAGGDADRGHPLWIEPGPHAVVALADEVDVADPLHAEQFVAELDRGVIGEEGLVVERPAGRVALGGEVDDHHRRWRFFQHGDPLALHERREGRQRQGDANLRQHLRHVRIGARGEGDDQPVAAVIGRQGAHRQRVLDAADLLLDRCGDRVAHHLGVRPRIDRRHLDRGRGDVGILRRREDEGSDAAGKYQHDRDHRGEDRSGDEVTRDHGRSAGRCRRGRSSGLPVRRATAEARRW